jgi:hypothetical protein
MGFLEFLPPSLARPADNPDYTQGIPQPIVRAGDSAAPYFVWCDANLRRFT